MTQRFTLGGAVLADEKELGPFKEVLSIPLCMDTKLCRALIESSEEFASAQGGWCGDTNDLSTQQSPQVTSTHLLTPTQEGVI